ncbi:MAG TPA: methionine ABC transporter ATP-binding protein, partial [Clostridium sp.]|nr:methionine ABC transporter ATP-binding protein [Clostridium sp.]
MIEILSVEKSFGDLKVLKDINLKINKGEIFGIVGHSGVGKST